MKTAMQELIEWCNSCLTDLTLSEGVKTALDVTIVRATDLLEKEKEQIINACNSAFEDKTTWGERYYNQTFK